MPYIKKETVALVRKALKETFKGQNVKFSVVTRHHSTIDVAILEAPIQLESLEGRNINEYHYKKHFDGQEDVIALIEKVMSVINEKAPQGESYYDSDYGNIPSHYINVSFGRWDKPFVSTLKEAA